MSTATSSQSDLGYTSLASSAVPLVDFGYEHVRQLSRRGRVQVVLDAVDRHFDALADVIIGQYDAYMTVGPVLRNRRLVGFGDQDLGGLPTSVTHDGIVRLSGVTRPHPYDQLMAKPEKLDLLRLAFIFHAGAVEQLTRMRAVQQTMMDEIAGPVVDGDLPTGTRESEFRFEYEFHFLLIAAAQLDKTMRQLGFAGFERDVAPAVKDLRDWYTHFEDPEGQAFDSFVLLADGAHPGKLTITADEVVIGGDVLTLSTLETALSKIGTKLPKYEQRLSE